MADNNYSNWWQEYVLPFEPQAAYYSATPFGAGPSAGSPFGRDYWQTDPSTQAERAPSQAFVEAGGFSPGAQQYWSGQYGNVMSQYLGSIGSDIRADREPAENFVDYLGRYPWTERYTALSPSMRGGSSMSRFAPAARWAY